MKVHTTNHENNEHNGTFMQLFCFSHKNKELKKIHKEFINIIKILKKRCTEEQGIFRKEGSHIKLKTLVGLIINNQPVDYNDYSIIDLGSVVKSYIRDYLNGLFEEENINIAIEKIRKKENIEVVVKELVETLNEERYECLEELKDLFKIVVENKRKTRVDYESICSIFCLTLTPQKVFKNIEIVFILSSLYKRMIVD